MNFSLCLTTYNRTDLLYLSYSKIIDDKRIEEVIIIDDSSTDEVWEQLQKNCVHEKIILRRNEENLGMLRNKREAIEFSLSEWCILFDSDNVLDSSYLDALEGCLFMDTTIFCPSFARPKFDFRQFSDTIIDSSNIKETMANPQGRVLMNCCNYVVHRDKFLEAWRPNDEIKGTDTLWMNYNWLKSGGEFFVVKGMEYDHLVHDGSGWLKDHKYNMDYAKKLEQLITEL